MPITLTIELTAQQISTWVTEEGKPDAEPFKSMTDEDFVKYRCAELINNHFHILRLHEAEKSSRPTQVDLVPTAPGRSP